MNERDELADLLFGPYRSRPRRPRPSVKFDGVRCGLHRARFHGIPRRQRATAVMEYVNQGTELELCELPANHDGHCHAIVVNPVCSCDLAPGHKGSCDWLPYGTPEFTP